MIKVIVVKNNRKRAADADATAVRVGKVPASLSNTDAMSMMYQFDLKNPVRS